MAALEPRTLLSAVLPGFADTVSDILAPVPVVRETVDRRGLTIERKRIDVEHRREFTEVVATFTDARPGGVASDYRAVIDWGDGQVSEGRIVPNDAGGYDVVGTHSYTWGWHAIGVTVRTETGGELRKVAAASAAYVIPPPIAGLGRTFEPVAGRLFRGPVATYVGLDATMLDRYVATVSWGDGQSSEAELVARADGSIRVVGTHTYERPGPYDLRVVVRERSLGTQPWRLAPVDTVDVGGRPISSFNDARSRAMASAGSVEGAFVPLQPMVGVPFSGVIGRFRALGGAGEVRHLRATVQWSEDGPEVGAILSPTADGRFVVKASHAFVDERHVEAAIRIYDDRLAEGASKQVALARTHLFPEAHLTVRGKTVRATEGVAFNGTVGWITSVGSGTLWKSSFKVTIQWGDGQMSPGRVICRGEGRFEVRGTHTYGVEGYAREEKVRITVVETRRPLDGALPTPSGTYTAHSEGYVDVAHGPIEGFTLHMEQPSLIIRVGEVLKRPWALATITVSDPALLPGDFAGTIAWDGGTTWEVLFEHHAGADTMVAYVRPQFATAGERTGTLTVTGAGMTRTATVEASVRTPLPAPAPPFAEISPGDDINAVKGTLWRGTVARFKLNDPTIDVSALTATVSWGDGGGWGPDSTSVGQIIAEPGGYYRVVARHTYARAIDGRKYDVRLSAGGDKMVSTLGGEVVVRVDPTRLNVFADAHKRFRQHEEFTTRLAYFTYPDASARAGDFEAWIDWGDGRRSRGVITERYGGGFDVTGTHTYAISGEVSPTITVTGPGGADVVPSWISLDREPVLVTPTKPVVEGLEVHRTLATFIDEDGPSIDEAKYHVAHAALIDWGDGKIGMGVIEQLPDGTFTVSGDHEYANSGTYRVRLVVRRNERRLPGESVLTRADGSAAESDVVESEYRTFLCRVRVRRVRQTPEAKAAPRSVPDAPAPPPAPSSSASSSPPVRLDPRVQWLYSLTRIEF